MKEQAKQLRYDKAYLRMAKTWSELSHCNRKQVGAIIVKDGMIISDGYNGTPSGFDNCCENPNPVNPINMDKISAFIIRKFLLRSPLPYLN